MSELGDLLVLFVAFILVVAVVAPLMNNAIQSVPKGMPDSGPIKALMSEPVIDLVIGLVIAIFVAIIAMARNSGFG